MPRFVSKDGEHAVETSSPREGVTLRAQGYREQKARTAAVRKTDEAVAAKKSTTDK